MRLERHKDINDIPFTCVDFGLEAKAEKKVLAISEAEGATTYINAIGGQELYDAADFKSSGIELKFIKSNDIEYQQFDNQFVPWLSIIDVLMFNDKDGIKKMLEEYSLV